MILIRNDINKLIKSHYPGIKLQFVFSASKRISPLSRYKDRFPSLLCSNVIYKYSCNDCNATCYGKASRNLLICCNEHLGVNKKGR